LHTMDFNQVTVANLCRQADVGRATFYTHFDNLTDVLEELVEDAIKATQRSTSKNVVDSVRKASRYLKTEEGMQELEKNLLLLPVCQRVADHPRYNILFKDAAISDYILSMIYRQERDLQVPQLMEECHLSETEAEMLFVCMITGAFAVNKAMGWKKDRDWMKVQRILLTYVAGGIDALKEL
ncbi:MAG: TetR/AcrR family transcriptional regulator, partial [Lachnospiraceae bacterium]|nr:TetR/AcrR family transcriptional regulator [Lachnospiraceae bacterium]